jgi:Ca2+/H+ antiporter
LEKFEVNVKIKLSGLWAAMMLCFAYADILAHMRSDIVQGILDGELAGIQITPEALIASAILMLIPILMIFLSLALNDKVARWLNIILGAVYAVINLSTMLMTGGGWTYYYIFAVIEVVLSVVIVWFSWKWK